MYLPCADRITTFKLIVEEERSWRCVSRKHVTASLNSKVPKLIKLMLINDGGTMQKTRQPPHKRGFQEVRSGSIMQKCVANGAVYETLVATHKKQEDKKETGRPASRSLQFCHETLTDLVVDDTADAKGRDDAADARRARRQPSAADGAPALPPRHAGRGRGGLRR